jgi:hypothetical protein
MPTSAGETRTYQQTRHRLASRRGAARNTRTLRYFKSCNKSVSELTTTGRISGWAMVAITSSALRLA